MKALPTVDSLFLITSATGNTGLPTVELLHKAGHRVRAFVHTIDERSKPLQNMGVEVVAGDLRDLNAVSQAMAGVSAAYFCYPIAPGGLLEGTAIFAQAASEAGVHAIVNMSQISARREATSNAARHHWLAERLLDRTAVVTTHLRPTFFMEWLSWSWIRCAETGIIRLPFADARHAPIAGRDQARVIAAILQNPDPHNRQIYPLFGAEELDYHQIASKAERALDIPVQYEPIGISEFTTGLTASGASDPLVQHLSNVAQDYRDGVFAGINNLVEVIGGGTPMTVEEYVATHGAAFDANGYLAMTDAKLART